MQKPNSYIGRPVERLEDLRFLTGRGQYLSDLNRPDQLHARVVRSPIAHGRIKSIYTEKALSLSGVHGVITGQDLGTIPKIPLRTSLATYAPYAQPIVAYDYVRYVGEPIALVLAVSPEIAEDAADTVIAEFEEIQAIVNRGQSLAGGVNVLSHADGNVAGVCQSTRGDAKSAFDKSFYTRKERFRVHRHAAMPMETRGLLAEWDNHANRLTMHGAAKSPFFSRKSLAQLLDLPEGSVDYIEWDVGGGFGARGEVHPEDFLIAIAAQRFCRPVKWIEDRHEHFSAMNHARDVECEIEIALDRDGIILGLRGEAYVDIGAYARPSCITAVRNVANFMSGGYRVPNIDVRATAFVTNKTPSGVYRGPGRYESCFFFERMLDIVAADLGLDRLDLRHRNLVTADEMPFKLPDLSPSESAPGFLDSGHYPEALDVCAAEFLWHKKSEELDGRLIDGVYHGIGCACFVEGGATGPRENVRIDVTSSGQIHVYAGSSAVGQGLETVLAQIAADTLEQPIDRVSVHHGSTNIIDEGFGSSASRSTVMGGNAVVLAGMEVLARFRALASELLCVKSGSLEVSCGVARTRDGRECSFCDVAHLGLSGYGRFVNSRQTYTYGTAMAHVTVDPGTGKVEILEYRAVDDVGRAINPATLHSQVVGAAVQGIGGVLSEELLYDETGQLLTGSFADYITPIATDYPNIHAKSMENYRSPNNPLGAKGAGEGGIIPVAGAISNAVSSALSSFEVDVRELPLTPPRVWQLIRQRQS